MFLTLFQFLTQLLTSKHLKPFSTYLVLQNGTMWKTCFSAPQNAKKNQLIHKNQSVTGLRVWRIILVITRWAHKRQTFTLISIKVWEFGNFLFTINRLFIPKEDVSNLHDYSNGLGKMWPSYSFHFSTRILNSTHKKGFKIFFA